MLLCGHDTATTGDSMTSRLHLRCLVLRQGTSRLLAAVPHLVLKLLLLLRRLQGVWLGLFVATDAMSRVSLLLVLLRQLILRLAVCCHID